MKEDLTGRQFGRLFVVGDGGKNEKGGITGNVSAPVGRKPW